MNCNINTQPLLDELNNIINISIQNKLNNLVERNNLLEETHLKLVSLPSVKTYFESKVVVNECKTQCDAGINTNQLLRSIEEKMNNHFDKLMHEISELKNEIKNLKENKKDNEKENIKLEIEEVVCLETKSIHLEEEVEEVEELEEEIEDSEEEELDELEEEEDVEDADIKSVETETKEEVLDEDDEEEEELIEIEIDDITYCTNDENNGLIYQLDKEGNVGEKIGYLKDGEAYFD